MILTFKPSSLSGSVDGPLGLTLLCGKVTCSSVFLSSCTQPDLGPHTAWRGSATAFTLAAPSMKLHPVGIPGCPALLEVSLDEHPPLAFHSQQLASSQDAVILLFLCLVSLFLLACLELHPSDYKMKQVLYVLFLFYRPDKWGLKEIQNFF